ncbi:MAG: OmpH family outer membrane protein, partial [Burkholderiales bacterium]
MKISSLVLVLIPLLAGVSAAMAAETRIGVVRIERLLREAAPAVAAEKKLKQEFAPRDQELQKVAKHVRELQSSLDKEAVTLSESQRRDKEQELARMNRDLQRIQREFREDLNLRRNEEFAAIIERANKVIQQIADAEKFDLILQEAVYISPRIDIT